MDLEAEILRRITNIEGKQLEGYQRLTVVETTTQDMEQKLFGNGQPGLIEKFDERLKRAETTLIKIAAWATGVVVLIEAFHTFRGVLGH